MADDKKIAAAIAAVNRYLEMEAVEHDRTAMEKGSVGGRCAGLAFGTNLWGVCGRMDRMQVRTLMQLRAFNKRIDLK